MTIYIIQNGTDGFGHQLHGLFSTMILHGCGDYYFDGFAYLKKDFCFEHIPRDIEKVIIIFLKKSVFKFIKHEKLKKIKYRAIEHVHEINKIPSDYGIDILYTIDNAYYFNKLPNYNPRHLQNIDIYSSFFRENIKRNPYLEGKNIVVHVRLGDSIDREGNKEFREKMITLMKIFSKKFKDHKIIIHSDGDPDFLSDFEFILFNRETSVMKVLSDFVWCDILVCCVSSLSTVASFLTQAKIILIPDETKHSVPSRSIRFDQFIDKTDS